MAGLLGVSGGVAVISFIFSMLGQGGGMVYMPLFHWLGYDIKTMAIPLGILLSATAKVFSLPQYHRHRLIDWKGAWPMMIAVLLMAPLGAWATPYVPEKVLLWAFAAMLLVAAVRTLWAVGQPDPDAVVPWLRRVVLGSLVAGGAAFIGGLLGIAGGFIISPMLMWIGYSAKKSAATTAAIATLSSLAGFAGHVSHMSIPWFILVLTLVAAMVGSVAGSWFLANRAKPAWVKAMYGVILIGIAGQLIGEPWHLGNVLAGIGVLLVGGYLVIRQRVHHRGQSGHLSA
ncbi:sulfite exporter TauE/SafE family protein [Alicyclobacillaceae bacterium I2511]|nr:sulfite exporter TauE/SafE family protein [Alicyclobacillaceae bacterium I2511]